MSIGGAGAVKCALHIYYAVVCTLVHYFREMSRVVVCRGFHSYSRFHHRTYMRRSLVCGGIKP